MSNFPTPQQKAIYADVMKTLDSNHGNVDIKDAIAVLAHIVGAFIARGAPASVSDAELTAFVKQMAETIIAEALKQRAERRKGLQ
jgi:hypothetical protein